MGEILSFENAVNSNNKRAEKMNAIGQLTLEEFETAYLYFGGKCVYSGKPIDTKLSIEHIIPIMSGGHSLAFNCVPVIKKYNEQKSGFHLLDWWRMQTGENGKSLYNPHRLLKLINYMVKSLEAINTGNETTHVLIDNEIDKYLNDNLDLLNKDFSLPYKKPTYKNISKIETYMRMEMSQEEYIDKMYDELDRFKLNVAIFFEEAIYELSKDIPMEVIEELKQKISNIPNIYIDGKKIFKKEMNEKDIEVRKAVIHWAEDEKIDNKYGIVGYMDFEVLKKQEDIVAFLDSRKQKILELLGANEKDFNNIVNKIPNILTDLDIENRVKDLIEGLKINTNKVEGKSSELYRYVTNKPDLLLSGENMNILLQYARKYDIDKRIFKKGIPITTILDNLEVAIDVVKKANFGLEDKFATRIIEKIINNSDGKLLRDAFKNLKKIVKNENKGQPRRDVERNASRWFICISEKYTALEMFSGKRINQTRNLYKDMQFDEEGFLKGVNPNAYIIPKIIRFANLKIDKEAEAELINNVFASGKIKSGERADKLLKELAHRLLIQFPDYSEEDIVQEASRWFVYISEMSQVSLDTVFNEKEREEYLDITQKHYKEMKFTDKGEFIDTKLDELKGHIIGVDYMKIANSYLNSKGDYYLIKGNMIPKEEIESLLEEELSKCKNKSEVKKVCIRTLKKFSSRER